MAINNEKKWRLMTHKEMENGYRYDDPPVYSNHAYITNFPEGHNDPLYSIDVCDSNNEEHNTLLALEIIVHLNYEDLDVSETDVKMCPICHAKEGEKHNPYCMENDDILGK